MSPFPPAQTLLDGKVCRCDGGGGDAVISLNIFVFFVCICLMQVLFPVSKLCLSQDLSVFFKFFYRSRYESIA